MLIAFEGGEGSGKSTQAELLAERLGAVLTHEPGATALGARIRELLLDHDRLTIDARAEALLMAADRAEHLAEVIGPALARGDHVVTDRYLYSSLAYQGFGRGLPLADVRALSDLAGAREADIVVLLAVSPPVRAARLDRSLDRFEAAGAEFHDRVEAGFRELAAADPERWVVVDGDDDVESIAARIWDAVSAKIPT